VSRAQIGVSSFGWLEVASGCEQPYSELKKIDVSIQAIPGDDDQMLPSPLRSADRQDHLNATLKVYDGAPHEFASRAGADSTATCWPCRAAKMHALEETPCRLSLNRSL
jgi:dienelactone hydrolase